MITLQKILMRLTTKSVNSSPANRKKHSSFRILSNREKSQHHLKNQDSKLVVLRNDLRLLAVADGHGGGTYVRSSMGSKIACFAARQAVEKGLTGEELKREIKESFDRMVEKHIGQHPFEPWELQKIGNHSGTVAYGTTLLLVAIHPDFTECLQLGDGEIHLLGKDGRFLPAFSEDPDCMGNATSSMCYRKDKAISHMRSMIIDEPAAGVILFTDGYIHKTDRPYELASLLKDAGNIASGFLGVLANGRRGDDQTCIFAFDMDIISKAEFQNGLNHTLQEREIAEKKEALKAEIVTLEEDIENMQRNINGFRKMNMLDKAETLEKMLQPYLDKLHALELKYGEFTQAVP